MKRLSLAVMIAALAIMLAAASAAAQNSITVQLNAQNNSGESGTATLTAMGNQTKVTLNLQNAPSNPQPAHIHPGTCANLNPQPKYPLTNVQNGTSETTVNASLDSLMTGGFAINVHKSAAEIQTYVSCGDIPAAGAAQVSPATGHGRAPAALGLAGALAVLATLALGGGALLRRGAR